MTDSAHQQHARVGLTNSVLVSIIGATQAQLVLIEKMILDYPTVNGDRSSWLKRSGVKNGEHEFLAVIVSPRQFEGRERNKLRADITRLIPHVEVSIW